MIRTKHSVLAALIGLAAISAIASTGLVTTFNVAMAQVTAGNQTNSTTIETAPSAIAGNATDNTTNSTAASITLNPTSGSTGTNVTITGTGFSPSQTFNFTFDNGYILTGNMVQFATGEFNTTALIPVNATSGAPAINVSGSQG